MLWATPVYPPWPLCEKGSAESGTRRCDTYLARFRVDLGCFDVFGQLLVKQWPQALDSRHSAYHKKIAKMQSFGVQTWKLINVFMMAHSSRRSWHSACRFCETHRNGVKCVSSAQHRGMAAHEPSGWGTFNSKHRNELRVAGDTHVEQGSEASIVEQVQQCEQRHELWNQVDIYRIHTTQRTWTQLTCYYDRWV